VLCAQEGENLHNFLGLIAVVIAGTCEVPINDVSGACLAKEACIVFDDDHVQTWLAGSHTDLVMRFYFLRSTVRCVTTGLCCISFA